MLNIKTTSAALALTNVLVFGLGACADADFGTTEETVSGRPSFEVFKGEDGRFFFNFSAANHEIILQSQGYSSRTAALGGLLSVLDHGGFEANYELSEAADGSFYFNLVAGNGEVIGTSETYGQRSDAARAINTTIDNVDDYLAFQASRRGARFVVFEGHDGRFFFHLRARNGEIVLQSQGYKTEAAALNGTFSVATSGLDLANYELLPSGQNGFYFNVKATNGQVVGTSEVYSTQSNARRACEDIADLLTVIELL
jgi:hypothetical protein